MRLPADSHVHSEFSWDTGGPASAARGTMEASSRRAARIDLPGLFFTEHLDLAENWFSDPEDFDEHEAHLLADDGIVTVPRFDADGYLASIQSCRAAVPSLWIGTGLEVGQPHLHLEAAGRQLDLDRFDRILGSLHTLEFEGRRAEPNTLFRRLPADEVVRRYLAEIPALVAGDEPFGIVTHLDYAVRYWPEEEIGPFDPRAFEREFRAAMQAIAESGRALEMNTRRLWSWMPQWWSEAGGRAISLGSDSHSPATLAHGFPEAIAMVEACGFRPGRNPEDLWTR
ncbi:hypothetical protein BH708_14710 [Brachybacterium sp. P6-10-X1]|uniref:PHP domain-containing protein n=1 Tax=Brachybacterium sp. P6-10-X1 TaxID=1903186 RepID=UPI0009718CDB|nr:PHP domain-containing protein [Brachybacterium sp. P6-10-X1]APX34932.1 hypothetical protein BH708_14710 [Brachybacterium sp. P6-10-X1]